jgi:TolA-binding protein
VYLARAEARRGNTDAAVAAYRAVMERYPEHAEATAVITANSR